jgi:hypothetical protein
MCEGIGVMTPVELLGLLGRSWSRLLLYPAGLGLLVVFGLIWWQSRQQPEPRRVASSLVETIAVLVPSWLGLALLPLPLAANIGRSIDLVFALALLEWPRLLVAMREARQGHVARLAALLNSYPPLLGAVLLLALPNGSFDLPALVQLPSEQVPLWASIGHWLGAVGLIIALSPMLGIGPFRSVPTADWGQRLGLGLRALGLVLIAALPWLALIPEHTEWLLVPSALIAVGLVAGLDRLGAGRSALVWARVLLWLATIEVALALVAGGVGLADRLR